MAAKMGTMRNPNGIQKGGAAKGIPGLQSANPMPSMGKAKSPMMGFKKGGAVKRGKKK